MTRALHEIVRNSNGIDDYALLVREVRLTADELLAIGGRIARKERVALTRAAIFLTSSTSPVKDEFDTVIAVAAASAVVPNEHIEAAFQQLQDDTFPVDSTVSEMTRDANEETRHILEQARHETDMHTSFGRAMIHACAILEEIDMLVDRDIVHKWERATHQPRNISHANIRLPSEETRTQIHNLIYESSEPRELNESGLFG